MSLVEVPACLTVVAMVGGDGQAKKEGANCQVGRFLVFFVMTVALGEFLLPGGEMAGESKNGGEQGGDLGEG